MPVIRPDWAHISAHGMTIGGKHTWRDFGLLPKGVPVIAPAKPKMSYEDLPLASGSLDYTDALTGEVAYSDREGSIDFICLHKGDWASTYSELAAHLGGRRHRCILDDDPLHYYEGRFWVDEWGSSGAYGDIRISYRTDPHKYGDPSGTYDWSFDDLIEGNIETIYFGKFAVNGEMVRRIVNPAGSPICPDFDCSAAITAVGPDGVAHSLPAGHSRLMGLMFPAGESTWIFRGYAEDVIISYPLQQVI